MSKKRLILISTIAVVAVGGIAAYLLLREPALPPGFAGGNGRIEAKEIDISTKYPGRIKQVLVDEGDTVESGQVMRHPVKRLRWYWQELGRLPATENDQGV